MTFSKPGFFILSVAILLMSADQCFAWGNRGHKIIVQVAKSQLSKGVIEMVDYYLQGMSWEDAACELDEEKQNKTNDGKKFWHYVYFEKDKTTVATKEPTLINQLGFNIRILQNRSLFDNGMVGEAIKNLFHLVGDISSPVHCGYISDKGGINTAVKFKDKATNLHEVWDALLIEESKIGIWECSMVVLKFSDKEKAQFSKIDFTEWANDSRTLLLSVYDFKDATIDQAYIERNSQLVKTQLAKAGIRLAAVLNSFFKE
jgi:hypothetical protein